MNLGVLGGLIEEHGITLFFALGFAEFIGIPVATVPALIAGGALAGIVPGSNVFLMILAAAAGGWTADAIVFGLTRWKGSAVVDAACGLTSNPSACVLHVAKRVRRVGPALIFGAKFLPGVGNVIAPASALAGVGARNFLLRDLLALLVWAGVYTGTGWVFAPQVEILLVLAERYLKWLIPTAVVLIGIAFLWRLWRVRVHTRLHQGPLETG